jgi:hypothetical protein
VEAAANKADFTPIEMSIVLVVIGLIVGGILVGQDLIRAAYIQATITQVEQFNTSVNTFYRRYQALPGDINNVAAAQYGFATTHGFGKARYTNGNWVIKGMGWKHDSPESSTPDTLSQLGESTWFWSE